MGGLLARELVRLLERIRSRCDAIDDVGRHMDSRNRGFHETQGPCGLRQDHRGEDRCISTNVVVSTALDEGFQLLGLVPDLQLQKPRAAVHFHPRAPNAHVRRWSKGILDGSDE